MQYKALLSLLKTLFVYGNIEITALTSIIILSSSMHFNICYVTSKFRSCIALIKTFYSCFDLSKHFLNFKYMCFDFTQATFDQYAQLK